MRVEEQGSGRGRGGQTLLTSCVARSRGTASSPGWAAGNCVLVVEPSFSEDQKEKKTTYEKSEGRGEFDYCDVEKLSREGQHRDNDMGMERRQWRGLSLVQ